jgi:hypothetical protein
MANVAKLLMIQGGKCFYCGKKLALENATIDHVIAKALGGENTEANTVACCHSINQAFGNATPKEKLTAIINAGGRIDCPSTPVKKPAPVVTISIPTKPPVAKNPAVPPAGAKQPKATNQKAPPEIKPFEFRKPLQDAFAKAAVMNGGDKAMLTAISIEVRKLVSGFAVKKYGEKTFANLVKKLGYRIENNWCFPPK